ncbi:hypothetical protein GE061_003838 [Apolygus lucorum]|uniref:Uncharacterized protein n=1 Tax=Apolygus lucorum TaxID=248454 RepID=A0A6A4JUE8_APOLU|nr:hypothetical protein GE061_003838 [Apolygus lucorum]
MASPYGKGVVGLLKKGWHEIPGVMGTSVMALLGLGFGITGINNYLKNDKLAPTYKKSYIVVRPDDPKVKRPTHDWI